MFVERTKGINSINLQSVTNQFPWDFSDQSPSPPISMLCRDVTAFGWPVVVIQVDCTSETILTGAGIRIGTYCSININWFWPGLNLFSDWLTRNPKKLDIWSSQFLGFLLIVLQFGIMGDSNVFLIQKKIFYCFQLENKKILIIYPILNYYSYKKHIYLGR